LPRGRVDLVVVLDTFHHLDHRLEYLRGVRSALPPSGRVAIIDWKKEEQPVGPPLDHRMARDSVVSEMQAAGFVLAGEPEILPYQYVLIFGAHAQER
jgi:predicted methyltransferase